ncbi:MAG: ferredoxin [Actinomyces sp.]|nr:MAG: ferredoxin [Actinomyces sp.]
MTTDAPAGPGTAVPTGSVIRLAPSGKEVPCPPGDTVLAALERAGYALPNNCRAGACGECRTKVLSGAIDQGVVLDMALSPADRAAGYGLMCMAKPVSPVVEIEYGTLDALPRLFPPRERVLSVVTDKIPRTPSIVEVRLRPVGPPLRFWPGQYVMLGDPDAGAPPRPYSLANAPRPDGELHLLVARVPEGRTSGWIHERLTVGDRVRIDGPYGTFVGDPNIDTPVLCLAGGSGLAPILSLTDAALRRGFPHPVTILFSARTPADVVAPGLMAWWEARHRKFRFRVTYTGPDAPAGELTGRIPTVLDRVAPDLSATSVFIAGSPDFVEDCRTAATALGAAEERIFTERYVPQATAETPPPERLAS